MPSVIKGLVTRDGRKRAPRHLFGNNYRKSFPLIRVLLGLGIVYYVARESYLRRGTLSPHHEFIRKITISPYGVLGTQMSLQGTLLTVGSEPDESTAITDPADLYTIFTTIDKAEGTSGGIYKWLGLKGSFPDPVVLAIAKMGDAKHYLYGDKHVIHVTSPDFREGSWSERDAALELSRAYRNVLHEFVISECNTLRLAPISSDAHAGPLYNDIPRITHEALQMAFQQLHPFDKEHVLRNDKNIEMCVFVNREWDIFQNAFKNLPLRP